LFAIFTVLNFTNPCGGAFEHEYAVLKPKRGRRPAAPSFLWESSSRYHIEELDECIQKLPYLLSLKEANEHGKPENQWTEYFHAPVLKHALKQLSSDFRFQPPGVGNRYFQIPTSLKNCIRTEMAPDGYILKVNCNNDTRRLAFNRIEGVAESHITLMFSQENGPVLVIEAKPVFCGHFIQHHEVRYETHVYGILASAWWHALNTKKTVYGITFTANCITITSYESDLKAEFHPLSKLIFDSTITSDKSLCECVNILREVCKDINKQ